MGENTKILVNIRDIRKPYHNDVEPVLLEQNMCSDPFVQFDYWFKNMASQKLSYAEINAVALTTVSGNRPSSRMVLLKEYNSEGFVFFTNSNSRKARQFSENPNAAMLFYWPAVDRQVRVEGKIEQLDPKVAEEYWATRPLASRIGSKLSPQSSIIPNRKFLEDRRVELEKLVEKEGESAISRPDTWLGYMLRPDYFEFWQGQTDRVHDRLIYSANADDVGKWVLRRLAP